MFGTTGISGHMNGIKQRKNLAAGSERVSFGNQFRRNARQVALNPGNSVVLSDFFCDRFAFDFMFHAILTSL